MVMDLGGTRSLKGQAAHWFSKSRIDAEGSYAFQPMEKRWLKKDTCGARFQLAAILMDRAESLSAAALGKVLFPGKRHRK
jgi:hypothetical protein